MSQELWSTLVTVIAPNPKAMPAVLHSTIDLLESELARARAALDDIQPHTGPVMMLGDEVTVGAMAAYRRNLVERASDFYYGTQRLNPKDLGLSSDAHEQESCEDGQQIRASPSDVPHINLLDLLSNSVILDHMCPYLPISALLALAATSRTLRFTIMQTPHVFRHLDLSGCRAAQTLEQGELSVSYDEVTTEDEFYSAPLRYVFDRLGRNSILQGVRTLILDGLPVPADLISEIILSDRFNVNVLSIKECRHLNERKLKQILQYAVRPTRPKGTPRVKAIYLFSPRTSNAHLPSRAGYHAWWKYSSDGRRSSSSSSSASSSSASSASSLASSSSRSHVYCRSNEWYSPSGQILSTKRNALDMSSWAQTLQKCLGIISFDAVLCRGLRHHIDSFSPGGRIPEGSFLGPAIATVALGPRGCDGCHTAPEGPSIWGQSPDEQFPLLNPVPLHSSTTSVAKRPPLYPDQHPVLIARCADCLTDRWCRRCNKWFCSACLPRTESNTANLYDINDPEKGKVCHLQLHYNIRVLTPC